MSIATKLTSINNSKLAIKAALTNKGLNLSGKTLAEYAPTIVASSLADTADATAVAADLKLGKTAYVNGIKITGTNTDIMTTATIIKPQNGVHIIVKQATLHAALSTASTMIDTKSNASDRSKVYGFLLGSTDSQWNQCPSDGFGSPYDNAPITVEVTNPSTKCTLYYAWYNDSGVLSDWQSAEFPSSTCVNLS